MRGRKPKSFAMKQLSGNPSKKPLKSPPKGREGRMLCPGWLDQEGKRQWGIVTKQLRAMGILVQCDTAIIGAYCWTISRLKTAKEHIKEFGITIPTGTGGFRKNPSVSISEKCIDALRQLTGELGLSPGARERLSITPPPKNDGIARFFPENQAQDKWQGLLG